MHDALVNARFGVRINEHILALTNRDIVFVCHTLVIQALKEKP